MRIETTERFDPGELHDLLELPDDVGIDFGQVDPDDPSLGWFIDVPPIVEWPPAPEPTDDDPEPTVDPIVTERVTEQEILDAIAAGTQWARVENVSLFDADTFHRDNPDYEGSLIVTGSTIEAAMPQEELEAIIAAHDPVVIDVDRFEIPADGQTAATVAYRRRADQAPAEVTFTVNGQAHNVATTAGEAALEVTAAEPGPIDIDVAGRTLTLEAV